MCLRLSYSLAAVNVIDPNLLIEVLGVINLIVPCLLFSFHDNFTVLSNKACKSIIANKPIFTVKTKRQMIQNRIAATVSISSILDHR